MNYSGHKDNRKSFHALTGLSHEQHLALLSHLEAAHDDYSEYEVSGKRILPTFCICKNDPLLSGWKNSPRKAWS